MVLQPEDLFKLVMAIVAGGLVGVEREYHDKAAGFRTYCLIAAGAGLFTILSYRLGEGIDVRIATGIVSGVGFLGAGAILRDGNHIAGLTTAAGIWVTAALGMGMGGGQYLLAGGATGMVLVVMWLFPFISHRIKVLQDEHTYVITCDISAKQLAEMQGWIEKCDLKVKSFQREKSKDEMICSWDLAGRPAAHAAFAKRLFDDPHVKEFHV
jgi:putative Mg2+ transporter-C (MgtC) family protein